MNTMLLREKFKLKYANKTNINPNICAAILLFAYIHDETGINMEDPQNIAEIKRFSLMNDEEFHNYHQIILSTKNN